MVSGGGREVEPVEPGVGVPGVVAAGGGQEAEEGENGGGGDHTVSWTVCWRQSLTGGCGYCTDTYYITYTAHSQILSSHSHSLATTYFSHKLWEIFTLSPPWLVSSR